MAWKVTGSRFDGQGPERELYVCGTDSEAVARNVAAKEQLMSRSVQHVSDADMPYDAWRVWAPRPKSARIQGVRSSLEELGNSELIRRPIWTLAAGVAIGVFAAQVAFALLTLVLALIFGASFHIGS